MAGDLGFEERLVSALERIACALEKEKPRSTRRSLTQRELEQRRAAAQTRYRKTRESIPDPLPTKTKTEFDFEALYKLYPRKKGKELGMRACRKLVTTQDEYDELRLGIERYAAEKKGVDEQFIAFWATFINQKRWKEYLPKPDETPKHPSEQAIWDETLGAYVLVPTGIRN